MMLRSETDHKKIVRNDFHQAFLQNLFFGVEERREENQSRLRQGKEHTLFVAPFGTKKLKEMSLL